MDPALALKIALALGVVIAAVVIAVRQDRKRRRLLRAWARARGLTLHEARRSGWEREYPAVKLFERGRSRHSALHVEGERSGRRVRVIDYRYTTGSGKNRRTHRLGVAALDAGGPTIPLRIRREHVFDKVGEFLGHDDIDFESSEFSRRFHVSSPDRRWAYDVIHQETMDYLLAAPPVTIEFGLGGVVVYRGGALTGAGADELLKVAGRLLDLVPQDVLTELKGERA